MYSGNYEVRLGGYRSISHEYKPISSYLRNSYERMDTSDIKYIKSPE